MNTLLKTSSGKIIAMPSQNQTSPPQRIRILLVDDDF
jgi:hypothetical protein